MVAMGRLMTRELVEVVMLKILPAVPVETLEIMLLMTKVELEDRFLLASVVTRELAVKVAMLTLPRAVTWKKLAPVVEATVKMGRVWAEVEAAMVKVPPVGVEELMIKLLAALSQRKEAEPDVVEAAV